MGLSGGELKNMYSKNFILDTKILLVITAFSDLPFWITLKEVDFNNLIIVTVFSKTFLEVLRSKIIKRECRLSEISSI